MSSLLHSFCEVKIKKDGIEYPNKKNEYRYFFNSISNVSMKVDSKSMATCEITFTPSYQDAVKLLTSGFLGLFSENKLKPDENTKEKGDPGSITSAQAIVKFIRQDRGAEKLETDYFYFNQTTPRVEIEGNTIGITLSGTASTSRIPSGDAQKKQLAFSKAIYKKVIKEGETLHDLLMYISEKSEYDFVFRNDAEAKTIETKLAPQIMAMTLNDMLIQGCAKANLDYAIRNSIYIYDGIKQLGKVPLYEFVLWRQVFPESGIYPMFSFNLESDVSMFFSNRAFGTVSSGVDPSKKEIIDKASEVELDQGTNPASRGKLKAENGFEDDEPLDPTPTYRAEPEASSEDEAKNEARLGGLNHIDVSFQVPGLPDLAPLEMVTLRVGDIKEFALAVQLQEVEHIWGEEGWIAECKGTITGGLGEQLALIETKSPQSVTTLDKTSISIA